MAAESGELDWGEGHEVDAYETNVVIIDKLELPGPVKAWIFYWRPVMNILRAQADRLASAGVMSQSAADRWHELHLERLFFPSPDCAKAESPNMDEAGNVTLFGTQRGGSADSEDAGGLMAGHTFVCYGQGQRTRNVFIIKRKKHNNYSLVKFKTKVLLVIGEPEPDDASAEDDGDPEEGIGPEPEINSEEDADDGLPETPEHEGLEGFNPEHVHAETDLEPVEAGEDTDDEAVGDDWTEVELDEDDYQAITESLITRRTLKAVEMGDLKTFFRLSRIKQGAKEAVSSLGPEGARPAPSEAGGGGQPPEPPEAYTDSVMDQLKQRWTEKQGQGARKLANLNEVVSNGSSEEFKKSVKMRERMMAQLAARGGGPAPPTRREILLEKLALQAAMKLKGEKHKGGG